MDEIYRLIASVLYGTGMRLMECAQLRVKDLDFGRTEMMIREGKGAKDRVTMLPLSLFQPLREQLADARDLNAPNGLGHTTYAPAESSR